MIAEAKRSDFGERQMSSSDIAGKAMTVLGPVEPAALGATLTHDILILDSKSVGRATHLPEHAPPAPYFHAPAPNPAGIAV